MMSMEPSTKPTPIPRVDLSKEDDLFSDCSTCNRRSFTRLWQVSQSAPENSIGICNCLLLGSHTPSHAQSSPSGSNSEVPTTSTPNLTPPTNAGSYKLKEKATTPPGTLSGSALTSHFWNSCSKLIRPSPYRRQHRPEHAVRRSSTNGAIVAGLVMCLFMAILF